MTESATPQNQEGRSRVRAKPAKESSARRKVPCTACFGSEHDSTHLQAKPVLQRTCACGQHTIGGGSCPACSQKHLSVSGDRSTTQAGEAEFWANLPHPGFQRDLSRIPATRPVSTNQARGGEGAGVDDPETLVGGELKPTAYTVAQRSGQLIQREDESESNAMPLSITTITAPTNLGCGGFRDQVRWELPGAGSSTNGFVVQKVTFDLQREGCDGGDRNFQKTYWEAWQVRQGKIYIGTGRSLHNADTFQVPSAPNYRGSCYEAGWAKFIPDYEQPHSWGNVPEARALPSTTSEPLGWSESGTIHRYMRSTFNCCGQSDPGEFDFGGSSNA